MGFMAVTKQCSDHFDRLYQLAEKLIELDKAYVCSVGLTAFHLRTPDLLTDNSVRRKTSSSSAAVRRVRAPGSGASMPSRRSRKIFKSSATCVMESTNPGKLFYA